MIMVGEPWIRLVTMVFDGRLMWRLEVGGKVFRRGGRSRRGFAGDDFTYCAIGVHA
jgi:hypothetical protein